VSLLLSLHDHGEYAIVAASGEIDIATAPALQAILIGAVDHPHKGHIMVDLADVSFIDASGLSVLIRADNRARTQGSPRPLLVALSPQVKRLLQVTGLYQHLPIHRGSCTVRPKDNARMGRAERTVVADGAGVQTRRWWT
jgi:anti-sigma B factor antagonist